MTDSEKDLIRSLIRQTRRLELSITAVREILVAFGIMTDEDFQRAVNSAEFDQEGKAHQMLLDLLGPQEGEEI